MALTSDFSFSPVPILPTLLLEHEIMTALGGPAKQATCPSVVPETLPLHPAILGIDPRILWSLGLEEFPSPTQASSGPALLTVTLHPRASAPLACDPAFSSGHMVPLSPSHVPAGAL